MDSAIGYLAILLGSVVPWFELFVIPPGIALGLEPVAVGVAALAGNAAATVLVVVQWERLTAWWERRRGRPLGAGARSERGRRAFERYGVPGLALQGPVLTGIYLAAVLALTLGATRRTVLVWSLVSIAVWTVVLVAATVAGVNLLGL